MRQAVLVLVMTLTAVYSFAAPLNHKQVPASAAWIAHVDLETFRSSQFGRLTMEEIKLKFGDKVAALSTLLGTNVLTDIQSLTLYGSDAKETNAASLIRGRFDKEKMLAFLKLNPAYAEITYDDKTMYKWVDDSRKKDQYGAFAAEDLVVIAQSQSTLQRALDVLAGKQPVLADQPQLPLFSMSQAPQGAFVIVAAKGLSELAGSEQAAILKNSNLLVFITSERAGVLKAHLQLESESEESATQIEQVVRGMLAFASLQTNNPPMLQKIIQTGIIARNGRKLEFDFSAPSADIFELLKSWEQISTPVSKPSE